MKKFEEMKQCFCTIQDKAVAFDHSKTHVSSLTADFDQLFELCWKTLKEYLYSDMGIRDATTGSPKTILKIAYREHIINDEEVWLDILQDRNNDAHKYNESEARAYSARILRKYIPVMSDLIEDLKAYIPEEDGILLNVPDRFIELQIMSGRFYDEFLCDVLQVCQIDDYMELFGNWEKYESTIETFVNQKKDASK